MLLIENRYDGTASANETLTLPFEKRCKSRLRTTLDSGEEVGLFLERGTILRGGDALQAADGRIVLVVAAPQVLLEARGEDGRQLARFAYHLGNRHVAVEVGPEWVRIESDPVLQQMLLGLGAIVRPLEAPFEPEAGAYAPGHQHGDESGALARIHQFGP